MERYSEECERDNKAWTGNKGNIKRGMKIQNAHAYFIPVFPKKQGK